MMIGSKIGMSRYIVCVNQWDSATRQYVTCWLGQTVYHTQAAAEKAVNTWAQAHRHEHVFMVVATPMHVAQGL